MAEPRLTISTNDLEVEPADPNLLKIVCPRCYRELYQCDFYELFPGDTRYIDMCHPLYASLPNGLLNSPPPICPYDGYSPITDSNPQKPGYASVAYTSRGWQPRRDMDPNLMRQFDEWLEYVYASPNEAERKRRQQMLTQWAKNTLPHNRR